MTLLNNDILKTIKDNCFQISCTTPIVYIQNSIEIYCGKQQNHGASGSENVYIKIENMKNNNSIADSGAILKKYNSSLMDAELLAKLNKEIFTTFNTNIYDNGDTNDKKIRILLETTDVQQCYKILIYKNILPADIIDGTCNINYNIINNDTGKKDVEIPPIIIQHDLTSMVSTVGDKKTNHKSGNISSPSPIANTNSENIQRRFSGNSLTNEGDDYFAVCSDNENPKYNFDVSHHIKTNEYNDNDTDNTTSIDTHIKWNIQDEGRKDMRKRNKSNSITGDSTTSVNDSNANTKKLLVSKNPVFSLKCHEKYKTLPGSPMPRVIINNDGEDEGDDDEDDDDEDDDDEDDDDDDDEDDDDDDDDNDDDDDDDDEAEDEDEINTPNTSSFNISNNTVLTPSTKFISPGVFISEFPRRHKPISQSLQLPREKHIGELTNSTHTATLNHSVASDNITSPVTKRNLKFPRTPIPKIHKCIDNKVTTSSDISTNSSTVPNIDDTSVFKKIDLDLNQSVVLNRRKVKQNNVVHA